MDSSGRSPPKAPPDPLRTGAIFELKAKTPQITRSPSVSSSPQCSKVSEGLSQSILGVSSPADMTEFQKAVQARFETVVRATPLPIWLQGQTQSSNPLSQTPPSLGSRDSFSSYSPGQYLLAVPRPIRLEHDFPAVPASRIGGVGVQAPYTHQAAIATGAEIYGVRSVIHSPPPLHRSAEMSYTSASAIMSPRASRSSSGGSMNGCDDNGHHSVEARRSTPIAVRGARGTHQQFTAQHIDIDAQAGTYDEQQSETFAMTADEYDAVPTVVDVEDVVDHRYDAMVESESEAEAEAGDDDEEDEDDDDDDALKDAADDDGNASDSSQRSSASSESEEDSDELRTEAASPALVKVKSSSAHKTQSSSIIITVGAQFLSSMTARSSTAMPMHCVRQ